MEMTRRRSWAPDWRTAVSGILIVLALPPFELSWLAWICLVPWFFALRRAGTYRAAWVQGAWLSFFMNALGTYWLAYSMRVNGLLSWPAALSAFFVYAWFGEAQFIAFAPVWKAVSLRRSVIGSALLLSLAYAGIDWMVPKLLVDSIGHALYRADRLRQIADLGGVPLITAMICLVNYAVWHLLTTFRAHSSAPAKSPGTLRSIAQESPRRAVLWVTARFAPALPLFALALASVCLAWLYGHFRLESIRSLADRPEGKIQAAVVQGNVGNLLKLDAFLGTSGANRQVVEAYLSLTRQALQMKPKPDFLVWPETAYPSAFRKPRSPDEKMLDQELEQFVKEHNIPLLFGGYDWVDGLSFNAFYFLTPRTQTGLWGESDLQTYHKAKRMFFGEYIPGAREIQWLRELFPRVAQFGRGYGPEVFPVFTGNPDLPKVMATPLICYEVLFSDFVINTVRRKSQFLLNITNDSWFGPWSEPYLHLALSSFRSVETRLPLLRATNTGITAFVGIDGSIQNRTQLDQPEILNVSIPIYPPIPTLMIAWGDWFGPLAFWITAISLAFMALGPRFRRLQSPGDQQTSAVKNPSL